MRLTYLALEAPREGSAGYTHVHEIIKGLKKRGWDITLHQPHYTDEAQSPGLMGRLLAMMGAQAQLWMSWRRGSVLYLRGHYMAFPTACLARILNIPIVHEINGPYEDVFITHPALNAVKPILVWMQRQQYRWASALIAVTDELTSWVKQESRGVNTLTIPNGANTDLFQPGLPRPNDVPERYALFFGGLAAWHGVPTMIEAAAHDAWPDLLPLVVIGEGQESASVRMAAQQNPHIVMLGKRAYQDLAPYVANALVGLVPISDSEGRAKTGLFPLKLFETLACGVPAIVTDFPGQADLVRQNQCGLVIPADDPKALAEAVAQLATDETMAKEMGRRGAESIAREHSWDARAEATNVLLKKFTYVNN